MLLIEQKLRDEIVTALLSVEVRTNVGAVFSQIANILKNLKEDKKEEVKEKK